MGKVKQSFIFFKDESVAKISDNELFINGNESLLVSVEGNGEIEIQGITDMNSTEWQPLALIKKSDFSVHEVITSSGIYSCSVDGYWKIRAEAKAIQDSLSVCVNLI